MDFSEIDLSRAKWISPEAEDPAFPRKDATRTFVPVTLSDSDFDSCPDFGSHAGYLRKHFTCSPGTENDLFLTAHGVCDVYLNGQKVSDELLSPGRSNYYMHQPMRRYDVGSCLKEGENEIVCILGNGWYRGSSGQDGTKFLFGKDLSLLLLLYCDGKAVLVSDTDWDASTDGPIRGNDMDQGEIIDATRQVTYLRKGREVRLTKDLIYLSTARPIRRHETFDGSFLTTPDGGTVIDFGQNLCGVVEICLKDAPAGGRLVLICGETLDADGNFTSENFQPGRRHFDGGIRQEIRYIAAAGRNVCVPSFTVMGFRYAKILSDFPVTAGNAAFRAHAVYSDMKETASFTSSSEALNALFRNCLWSMKSNFTGIPTSCPTRERAGRTVDAGLFVHTGLRLMDSAAVYETWLDECAVGQHRNGRVPCICPPDKGATPRDGVHCQSTAWGDASVIVPWEIYAYTGDVTVLKKYYPLMKKWFGYLEKRAGKRSMHSPLKGRPHGGRLEKYLIDRGFDYGEGDGDDKAGLAGEQEGLQVTEAATAYFARSGAIMARTAQIIAENLPEKKGFYKELINESLHFSEVSGKAAEAYVAAFTDDGSIGGDRQSLYVRPLKFDLLPENRRREAAAALNAAVTAAGYHANTGLLTTPDLCSVLARCGYAETAYRLLLNEESPSWLYAVKQGATSTWEFMDGIGEDRTVKGSLNHCVGGSIASFLLEDLAGIRWQGGRAEIRPVVAPVTEDGKPLLSFAEASLDSPAGMIRAGWKYEEDGSLTVSGSLPEGLAATLALPDGRVLEDVAGEFSVTIAPGAGQTEVF